MMEHPISTQLGLHHTGGSCITQEALCITQEASCITQEMPNKNQITQALVSLPNECGIGVKSALTSVDSVERHRMARCNPRSTTGQQTAWCTERATDGCPPMERASGRYPTLPEQRATPLCLNKELPHPA
ncbi:hypothetical protein ACOMHN_010930 [Nucella lapillus]